MTEIRPQRHYLEEELYKLVRQDERIFGFLQDGSLDGVWYADLLDGDAEWMSPRYKHLLGYADDEVENRSSWWKERMHPDDLRESEENFRLHVRDPAHPYDQIVRFRHKNGSTVWVRCRGIVIRDDEGKPVRMLGAHTDVTDLKMADELVRANAELTDRNEALRRFAGIVSHDLQTPMRHVSIYAGLLREELGDSLNGAARDYLEVIERGALQMRRMVQSLLEYSRLAYATVRAEPTALSEVVADALALLDVQIREAGATITVGALPEVYGERTLLVRLLQNLIANAVKYRSERPLEIRIDGVETEDGFHLAITDNGIGIAPANRDIIFEMFRRLHRDEKTYEGLGVGLAISRQIAESHGGRIWLDTTREEGSCFCVALPRTKAEFEARRA
ncbi:sensor histidine kinase [Methylobrevis pamukkalensis]|uniref:histidine kinase n=1 Tax=Methylobrevis pamukkalensis TaxID=1439726 RepID=A0A1E3H5J9_9HYPH|nr:PAS domain-containing sensor histidine kinase [Methylobrevis pamukkalensis]ODN71580.1 Phytochrome-like protein cph1 [Methylobrevis pamukkalensis]